MANDDKEWDVFISHASEDKEEIARPIATVLSQMGARVWFDELELKIGDSLSRKIDLGLSKSNFGVVVLSNAFLSKNWPEYELRGLNARELGRDKVILPIWHKIGRDDILKYSPPLADKLAILTDNIPIEQLCLKILGEIRPDLLTALNRKVAYKIHQSDAKISEIDVNLIKFSAARHKELPADLIGRIRLIRACFLCVYPHSMDFWVEGFKADAHPTREIEIWEHMAAVFVEALVFCKPASLDELFNAVMSLGIGNKGVGEISFEKLSKEIQDILVVSYKSSYPVIEVKDQAFMDDVDRSDDGLEIDIEDLSGDKRNISSEIIDNIAKNIISNSKK